MFENKRKPNRLFRGLLGVSLAMHIFIFAHVSGIYTSKALSYIELTMQDLSKPSGRNIPRPRERPKALEPLDAKRLNITPQRIPPLKPIKIETAQKDLPDSLVEGIMPNAPATDGTSIATFHPGDPHAFGDSAANYLDLVRLRIERYKKYPDAAKARQIEGAVTIRFVITPEGGVRAVEIVKTSAQNALDKAALRAVNAAAPFPKPPKRLFSGEIPLELTIVFELT